MYCKNCGKKLNNSANVCPNCGTNVNTSKNIQSNFQSKHLVKRRRNKRYRLLLQLDTGKHQERNSTEFGIGYNERILFVRDTSFWNSRNQGLALTDAGVYCIPDNDKMDEKSASHGVQCNVWNTRIWCCTFGV